MISSTKPSRPTIALTDLIDGAFSASFRLVSEQIWSRVNAMEPSLQPKCLFAFFIDYAGLLDVAPTKDAAGGGIDNLCPGRRIHDAVGEQQRVPDKFTRLEPEVDPVGALESFVHGRPVSRTGQNIAAGARADSKLPVAAQHAGFSDAYDHARAR